MRGLRGLPGALVFTLLWGGGCGDELDWPPDLESLYDDTTQSCVVPACSESGKAGLDVSGNWRRTLITTASNCPELVASIDARAVVGNVDITDPYAIDDVIGTCHYKQDVHIGTVRRAVFVECVRTLQDLDVISFDTGIAEFDGDFAEGKVRVYLRNLIGTENGCEVDLDVTYQR